LHAAPIHTRCPVAIAGVCDRYTPYWRDAGDNHYVACFRVHPYEGDQQPQTPVGALSGVAHAGAAPA